MIIAVIIDVYKRQVSVHVNERAAEQFAKNYAPDVVILQPKRLRDKLRDDLKKAWEAYED